MLQMRWAGPPVGHFVCLIDALPLQAVQVAERTDCPRFVNVVAIVHHGGDLGQEVTGPLVRLVTLVHAVIHPYTKGLPNIVLRRQETESIEPTRV